MRYWSKRAIVEAEQFLGTLASVTKLQDWASSLDLEDCELTYQGDQEPFALDVTSQGNITTAEAGSWVVCRNGRLSIESPESFADSYETKQLELPL